MSVLDFWRGSQLTPNMSIPVSYENDWNRLDNMFEDMSRRMDSNRMLEPLFNPACDIEETDSAWVFHLDIPGLRRDDIDIEIAGNQIIIAGERNFHEDFKNGASRRTERRQGNFRRVFTLPADLEADEVEASYVDGVLTIVTKKPKAMKHQKIEVKGTAGKLTEKVLSRLAGKHAQASAKPKVINAK